MAENPITRKIQILPKDTIAYTLPNRVIGSGKINRLVEPIKHKRKNKFNRIRRKDHKQTKDKAPYNYTIKPTSKEIRIWHHWRTKQKPMVQHFDKESTTKAFSISNIRKTLIDNTQQEIIAAIDLAEKCFNERWFTPKPKDINCNHFFFYNDWLMKNTAAPISGNSWFKEFLKGQAYIEANYSHIDKDKNPEVTAMVEEVYRNNQRYSDGELTAKEQNALIKCAGKAVAFAKANGIDFVKDAITPIDRIINNYEKPFVLNSPFFLCSKDLWQNQIPRELVRYGTYQRRSDIKIV